MAYDVLLREENHHYMSALTEIERDLGSGLRRIGTKVALRDDLYTMLFASCIYPEYILKHSKKKDIDDRDLQQMLTRHEQGEEIE